MKSIFIFLFLSVPFLSFNIYAQQVTLQPWVQVYGTVNGEQLGTYVTGIIPSSNFPYKAAVSKIGNTGVYTLQAYTDTSIKKMFLGENLITGDFNGDGYTDVVIAKRINEYDTVFIYWGTPTSLDTINPLKIPAEFQFDMLRPGCEGDINNDGQTDLILTAWGWPNGYNKGKVYIYLNPVSSTIPDTQLEGDSAYDGLARSCAMGDLNQDGIKDLMVRGNNQRGPQADRFDYVKIYWGASIDTLNLKFAMQLRGYNLVSAGLACFDVNGDSKDDLLWTDADSNFTSVDVKVNYGNTIFSPVPSLVLKNPGVGDFGGKVVANAGDVNGDGYNDILISAADATDIAGFVFVFGAGPKIDDQFDAAVGLTQNSRFGWSAATVGDVNSDGLSDIIVGAPEYSFGDNKGYWGIFLGDTAIRVTDVKEVTEFPTVFKLYQCYPNPFNPNTSIRYDLKQEGFVTLEIFNSTGQKVAVLVSKRESVGTYEVSFNATQFATGTYFYKLTVKTNDGKVFTQTKKMILLSKRDKNEQEEYEQLLLAKARKGDKKAQEKYTLLSDEKEPEWMKRFLLSSSLQKPDTIIYLKEATLYFYNKDISRLKEYLK